MSPEKRTVIEVDGRQLTVSNLDKVLYPDAAFTKADVIWYYLHVAPVLLPHLQGRPLTMTRYPDGVGHKSFFEKHSARGSQWPVRRQRAQVRPGRGRRADRAGRRRRPGHSGLGRQSRRARAARAAVALGVRRLLRPGRPDRVQPRPGSRRPSWSAVWSPAGSAPSSRAGASWPSQDQRLEGPPALARLDPPWLSERLWRRAPWKLPG